MSKIVEWEVAFSYHSVNFQPILDCFIPNFKLRYEDLENVELDCVSAVIFNLHQIKRRSVFGTPGMFSVFILIFFPMTTAVRLIRCVYYKVDERTLMNVKLRYTWSAVTSSWLNPEDQALSPCLRMAEFDKRDQVLDMVIHLNRWRNGLVKHDCSRNRLLLNSTVRSLKNKW